MPVFFDNSVRYVDLPSWTALVRAVVEVDTQWTSSGNVTDLMELIESVAHVQIALLFDRALDVALDPEFMDLALHILDRTVVTASRFFARNLFKYRFFCSFDKARVTWMEFQHQCGLQPTMPRQYLYVCCPHPDRMPPCPSIGPMLYLSAEQVPIVCAAIWDKLGCALTPAPEGTLDDIYTAHQEIYISDTLPYSELNTDWLLQGGAPKVNPDAATSESSGPDLEGFEHLYHMNYNARGIMSEIHVLSTGTRTRLTTQAYNGFIVHIPATKTVRDVLLILKRRLRINVTRLTLESHDRVLLPSDPLSSMMSMTMRIARPLRNRLAQPVLRRPAAAHTRRHRRMPENFNFRNEHMLAFADPTDQHCCSNDGANAGLPTAAGLSTLAAYPKLEPAYPCPAADFPVHSHGSWAEYGVLTISFS
eukprot:6465591-Amphidinium_carterae.1